MNNKKTIAAFLSTLTTPYHKNVSLGITDCAKLNNYNVLIYAGLALNAQKPYSPFRENIFNQVHKDQVSGIIIPTSSLSRYQSKEEFKKFLNRYKDFPIVTICGDDEEYINVKPDYAGGMEKLMDHLIETHNYNKIVYLRGPKNNNSSNERQIGYEAALKKHDIPLREELIISKDINSKAGAEVVNYLLDKNIDFDAIVAVNDNVAFSIINALKEHNIRVPEEKAVCGHQGRFECTYSSPPLTTWDEDSYKQGWKAAESLIKLLEGEEVKKEVSFDTKMYIRQSCGCSTGEIQEVLLPNDVELKNDNLSELITLLNNKSLSKREISERMLEVQAREIKYHKDKIVELFRRITGTVSLTEDLDKSIQFISQQIGMKHCYIMFYENFDMEKGKVIFQKAFVDKRGLKIDSEDRIMTERLLIPNKYLPKEENYALIVEPIFFKNMGMGYIMFDYSYRDGAVFESLKALLGSHIYAEYRYNLPSVEQ
ncbi:MAG: substrate-binding domain-containing protein [Spirochaetales bacterium]|nr:substrate-binding domain-containing protein [Spirochaetales bacterium]